MSRYVVIKDMSAGNAEIGEMWQETKIYDGSATLDEVMKWANKYNGPYQFNHSRKRITITKPHSDSE